MAKKVFVDGDPSIGLQGTIVDDDFLNGLQEMRSDGLDQDGSLPIDYVIDTGAVDAHVMTLVPVLSQLIVGLPFTFKAITANTGAATLNIDGLGAKTIKKNYNQDLAAQDIKIGQMVTVIYDGANYQMVSAVGNIPVAQPAVRGTYRGKTIKTNVTTPLNKVDVNIDEIVLTDSSGNALTLNDIDLTVDITKAGPNGLDSGAEGASKWYEVHVVGKPTDTSSGANTSVTANKLVDNIADFITEPVVVGDVVFNVTDSTWAKVTAIDSATQLALDADIFTATPKNYVVGPKAVALLNEAGTGLTLPTGYTYESESLGEVRNTSGSDFIPLIQEGKNAYHDAVQLIKDGTFATAAWTAQDITAFFPSKSYKLSSIDLT